MILDETFNLDELPESDNGGSFKAIPAGDYDVRIADAELKPTKSGSGMLIKLRLDITGPSYEGRTLFANLNIKNNSEVAEKIGKQQLGDVMRAIGLNSLSDTEYLIDGEMTVKVSNDKDPEYGDEDGNKNEVKAFKPCKKGGGIGKTAQSAAPWSNQAQQQSMPQPEQPAQPTQGGTGETTPPWAQ